MKKILFATIVLVSTSLAFADTSCKVTLKASTTSSDFEMYEIQGEKEITAGFDNGYDVLFNGNVPASPANVFIYAPAVLRDQKEENWSIICTDAFDKQALTVITNQNETSYKLVFSDVAGDIVLVDGDSVFAVKEKAEYAFEAAVSDTIVGRFMLKNLNAPTRLSSVVAAPQKARKMIVNGQLVIIRDDKVFTVAGAEK